MKTPQIKNIERLIGLFFKTILVFWSTQILFSCSPEMKFEADPNPRSPFDSEPLIVSPGLINQMIESSSNNATTNGQQTLSVGGNSYAAKLSLNPSLKIPTNTKFEVILEDECLRNRSKNQVKIKYFIDEFVNLNKLNALNSKINESVFVFDFKTEATIGDLQQIIQSDECIIGIADQVGFEMSKSSYNDPEFGAQDYLQRLGFHEADSFISSSISPDVRVKVAVIDSGIDLNGKDLGLIDSNGLAGTDLISGGDSPQDVLGHGTAVASLINAKSNNGFGITGIIAKNVEIIPMKFFGDSKSRIISPGQIYDTVRLAVNKGAEVINMSFSAVLDAEYSYNKPDVIYGYGAGLECNPLVGHAIQRSILRGSFFAMAAGHATSYKKFKDGKNQRYLEIESSTGQTLEKLVDESEDSKSKVVGKWIWYKKDANGSPLIANGAFVQCPINLDKKEQICTRMEIPGPIRSRKMNGPLYYGNTSMPACWGRYFKGAVAVASLSTSTTLSSFSNWGVDGVEILAPGEGIKTIGLNNQVVSEQGTSFSTPMVAAAASMIIAFHKTMQKKVSNPNEWHISPWAIEDILMNGIPSVSFHVGAKNPTDSENVKFNDGKIVSLAEYPKGEKTVARGKTLNLGSLSEYLVKLSNMTFDERRRQQTENTEDGFGHDPNLTTDPQAKLIGIQAYVEEMATRNRDKIQIQAVAYFSNGSTKVVTSLSSWSSSNVATPVDKQGVVYPNLNYKGTSSVTASFGGFTSTTSFIVTDVDIISGSGSLMPDLIQLDKIYEDYSSIIVAVKAVYSDGSTRDVTEISSYAGYLYYNDFGTVTNCGSYKPGYVGTCRRLIRKLDALPEKTFKVTAFLYGRTASAEYTTKKCDVGQNHVVTVQTMNKSINFVGPEVHEFSEKNIGADYVHDIGQIKFNSNQQKYQATQIGCGQRKKDPIVTQLSFTPTDKVLSKYKLTWESDPLDWSGLPGKTVSTSVILYEFKNSLVKIELTSWYTGPNPYFQFGTKELVMAARERVIATGVFEDGYKRQLGQQEYTVSLLDKEKNHDLRANGHKFTDGTLILNLFQLTSLNEGVLRVTSTSNTSIIAEEKFTAKYPKITQIQYERTTPHSLNLFNSGYSPISEWKISKSGVENNKLPIALCDQVGQQKTPAAAGSGSFADPFIVCNLKQLLETRKFSTLIAIKLGNHIDLTEYDLPSLPKITVNNYVGGSWPLEYKPLVNGPIYGNGFEFRNLLKIAGYDNGVVPIIVGSMSNLGFRNFSIQAKEGILFYGSAAATRKNIYLDNVKLVAEESGKLTFAEYFYGKNIYLVNSEFRNSRFSEYADIENGYFASKVNMFQLNGNGAALFYYGTFRNVAFDTKVKSVMGNAGGLSHYCSATDIEGIVDIDASGDNIGGLCAFGWGDKSSISRTKISGIVRGRMKIGGLIGGTFSNFHVSANSISATVIGSNAVGGLVGAIDSPGYYQLLDNDVSNSVTNGTGPNVSDFVGHINIKTNRGILEGPANDFNSTLIMKGNNYKGALLGENLDELSMAFEKILGGNQ